MVVTNNTLIAQPDVLVEGSTYDVLIRVRDFVYEGYELLVHPLCASIRTVISPIRTVILSDARVPIRENERSIILIGDAIITFKNLVADRKRSVHCIDDYRMLDAQLFHHAQAELKKL